MAGPAHRIFINAFCGRERAQSSDDAGAGVTREHAQTHGADGHMIDIQASEIFNRPHLDQQPGHPRCHDREPGLRKSIHSQSQHRSELGRPQPRLTPGRRWQANQEPRGRGISPELYRHQADPTFLHDPGLFSARKRPVAACEGVCGGERRMTGKVDFTAGREYPRTIIGSR